MICRFPVDANYFAYDGQGLMAKLRKTSSVTLLSVIDCLLSDNCFMLDAGWRQVRHQRQFRHLRGRKPKRCTPFRPDRPANSEMPWRAIVAAPPAELADYGLLFGLEPSSRQPFWSSPNSAKASSQSVSAAGIFFGGLSSASATGAGAGAVAGVGCCGNRSR